jgi:hypothetical protein
MTVGSPKIHSHHLPVCAEVNHRVFRSELPVSLPRLKPCFLWRRVEQSRWSKSCARQFVLPACCLLLLPAVCLLSQLLVVPLSTSPGTCILMTVSSLPQIVIPLHTRICSFPVILFHLLTSELRLRPPSPRTLQTALFIGLFNDVTKLNSFLALWEQDKLPFKEERVAVCHQTQHFKTLHFAHSDPQNKKCCFPKHL